MGSWSRRNRKTKRFFSHIVVSRCRRWERAVVLPLESFPGNWDCWGEFSERLVFLFLSYLWVWFFWSWASYVPCLWCWWAGNQIIVVVGWWMVVVVVMLMMMIVAVEDRWRSERTYSVQYDQGRGEEGERSTVNFNSILFSFSFSCPLDV